MESILDYLSSIDLDVFQALNGWSGRNAFLDYTVTRLDDVRLKSLAFIGTFGALWFQRTKAQGRQRETLILLFVAILASLTIARTVANLLPFHIRPMFTQGIGYRAPLAELQPYFENWSSFPSDTAAVIFAMTTGFWLVSRWWGLLWIGLSIIAILARVYPGIHYPGDVFVGALIGVGTTLAINNEFMRTHIAAPVVAFEQRASAVFYGLLLPFTYEVSSLFNVSRGMYHVILRILRHEI
jgi:undecaprenyl-diphosphatase